MSDHLTAMDMAGRDWPVFYERRRVCEKDDWNNRFTFACGLESVARVVL
jgi:hypothetical protein